MFLVSWPGGSWEATLKLSLTILALYLAVIWLALVFWTYRDIRQRTRDPIVQTVAVLLVLALTLPGLWIYLILRPRQTLAEAYERSLEEEALLQELEDQKSCPSCKRRVHDDFLVCPSCSAQLKEPCRSCSKPLSYAWVVCPYCGHGKSPREHARRPAARPAAASGAIASGGGSAPAPAPAPARTRQPRPVPEPLPQPTGLVSRSASAPEKAPPPPPAAATPNPFARREPGAAPQRAPVRVATDDGLTPLIDATRD